MDLSVIIIKTFINTYFSLTPRPAHELSSAHVVLVGCISAVLPPANGVLTSVCNPVSAKLPKPYFLDIAFESAFGLLSEAQYRPAY